MKRRLIVLALLWLPLASTACKKPVLGPMKIDWTEQQSFCLGYCED